MDEKTVLLHGKYDLKQLKEYVRLLGESEDASQTTIQPEELPKKPEKEEQLVGKATIPQ